ncbi:MAG: DUF502 domain-containing protein [Planctomycetes bacterium]|nr:DUF502 domain-containing protein [Planctomycetota bacterium]
MSKTFPFKKPFLTGLITLMPVILSLLVVSVIFDVLARNFGFPLGRRILSLVGFLGVEEVTRVAGNSLVVTLVGLLVTGLVVVFVGYLMNNFFGQRITRLIGDKFFGRLPLINLIYPYAKQIVRFLSGSNKKDNFKAVVAVEYPMKGIYVLGFVTSDGIRSVNDTLGFDCVTVFIPSSPTPFTGYTIFLSGENVFPLSISVDEALRLLVSGGILVPVNKISPVSSPESEELPARGREFIYRDFRRNVKITPGRLMPGISGAKRRA